VKFRNLFFKTDERLRIISELLKEKAKKRKGEAGIRSLKEEVLL
jgi:phosphopantothenate synthetase